MDGILGAAVVVYGDYVGGRGDGAPTAVSPDKVRSPRGRGRLYDWVNKNFPPRSIPAWAWAA